MIVKIESGPTEVIASGDIISFSGNPITLTFGSPNETLKIIFEFKDEEGKDDLRVEANTSDAQNLKVTFFNFKNPMGSGSVKPIPIGSLDGRRIYIQYIIYALTYSKDKMLHFNIYKAEEVSKNG
ncbi:MAG: hypothetical protein O8C62_08375 [Candidatus Methanoperedens sp.]|nr:hypothetical protein [Candidatus Methanoperedens sp.]